MNKYLIVGAGGFIGGHLSKRLLDENNIVIGADIKPLDLWFQKHEKSKNFSLNMQEYDNCLKMTKDVKYVINLACNMGGIGFIENNKADCMLSVLINTNLLRACKENKVEKYFFLLVHVHIIKIFNKTQTLMDLEKKTLIQQCQKMDMDGKNYLANECVDILQKIMD